ncbi:hypothetical protein [Kitasatospora griseola]|uniref:hypothetical protein n=1 Tax=Kitasatospora griseola TaxID=2064 RepID=UPI00380241EF
MGAIKRTYQAQQGRHRGARHDPMGTALTVLWAVGHLATLALLGVAVDHQLSADHLGVAPLARALPDHDPAV